GCSAASAACAKSGILDRSLLRLQSSYFESQLANTKIIIMSAVYKGYYHKNEIRESGADDFVLKPIDTDDLKNKVAKFLLES
ncbi:MAG: hypothetical protein MUP19_10320, partial [Candidatus Aminicenantes bacterium]|nr:hypothetical protein [Candidatus Aminicenantes bacterium]